MVVHLTWLYTKLYTRLYMKVMLWIDAMKLARIDAYCKEHKLSRSTLLTRGALSIVNSQPIPKCDMCKLPSIGQYELLVHTWDQGEQTVTKYLCATHHRLATSEAEVKQIN